MYSKKVYTGGGSSELGINYYFSIYHFLPKLYLINPRRHKSKKLHEGIMGGGGGVNWSPPLHSQHNSSEIVLKPGTFNELSL